ncbi:MAG: M13 family metallopeptidase [Thermomicrobiales bacterium]
MLPVFRLLIALSCLAMMGIPSALAAQTATPAATPLATPIAGAAVHGSLLAAMNPEVSPGDDFYEYAAGKWLEQAVIPPDRAAWSLSDEIDKRTTDELLGLLQTLSTNDTLPEGSDEWKAVQLFAQAMDRDTRNAQGVEPIQGDLDQIAAVSSMDELYKLLREGVLTTHISGFYGVAPSPDLEDSSKYALWYGGPSLGLPNRDYYWEDDATNEPIREAYRATSAKLLELAGWDTADAEDAAQRVYDFEKRLAEPLLKPEDGNNPANYYHPRPIEDLARANPDFNWPAFLEILGVADQKTVIVTEEKYLDAIDDILNSTDLQTIKDYLTLQVIWNTASALTQEMDDTAFGFYGGTLYGVEEQSPDDEQALGAVNGNLGFALGKLYVDEYFPPEAKAQIEELVGHIKDATRTRIENLDWMTPETKAEALHKLDTMRVKVGYPDKWRTYENVTIGDSYTESLLSANIAEYKRDLGRIDEPVDRDEWGMLPQTVNAYYSPTNNEIVFPAAILQPPYFDYQADPAYNYGAIGGTIGHEITHAFDQSGSRFDADGNLRNWWTDEDNEKFTALQDEVKAQYSAIEVSPDLFVNGDLTIGENIADMGGLQIAYDALQAALAENGDPGLIEGLTQEQRFFLAHAFRWAEVARPAFVDTLIKTDSHAPASVRAVEPPRNMDAFYEAFGIEPGDPEYLPPDERIVIW